MKTNHNQLNPDQDVVLTYVPDFQDRPFTITGAYEAVMPIAEQVEHMQPMPAVGHVQAPTIVSEPKDEYTDFSELSGREIARKKLSAKFYDTFHRTNMYQLLTDRIEEDRNVAFARSLGIVGVTHCAKHEKAVAKLKQLV